MPGRPLLLRGELLLPEGLRRGALLVEGGTIRAILQDGEAGPADAEVLQAAVVAPGFIDVQVNGGFGVEVERPGALRQLSLKLPSTGVTAWLPTVVSSPPEVYRRVLAAFPEEVEVSGARPLGLHLEGPFLSSARAGAHRRALIESARDELLDEILEAPRGVVAVMTLAPERDGALERVRRLRERGVVVSLGHTDASYEAFVRAVDAGATAATHLFNAMSPFTHRAPGAVGASLTDERVTVGLIADGVHAHPASLELALRSKGAEGIALITDAMAAAGMGPGHYPLGGQEVIVDSTAARLSDGTLAGSTLTLDQAVRNMVALVGATTEQALRMASETPARLLGLERKGRLAVGADADLVLLDAALGVRGTIVGGRLCYPSW